MKTQEKINILSDAMTVSKRDDQSEYTHFTDTAPEELKDAFLEAYKVRDTDYMIFSKACDIMAELYEESPENMDEAIYECANDCASVYTSDRLDLLDMWNQEDISIIMRESGIDIAEACAWWLDSQVKEACFIIKSWVEKTDTE